MACTRKQQPTYGQARMAQRNRANTFWAMACWLVATTGQHANGMQHGGKLGIAPGAMLALCTYLWVARMQQALAAVYAYNMALRNVAHHHSDAVWHGQIGYWQNCATNYAPYMLNQWHIAARAATWLHHHRVRT